ncbi:MAG: nucleotide pyrophosphatase [Deltaproteobacteria bacterium]|nr:nucleotide pyrophosphatase [Deltaproteobacteria bacterium]
MRTLFIGLDGATFTVLDKLASHDGREGVVMPFLSGIYREGTRCKLLSTPNPLTPPAWVSLMTGRSPGHHGVFDFIRAEERMDDVFFTLYDARDIRTETIWSIASRCGRSVAALNFPFTAPPPENLNGFIVPGFVPWRHLRRNTRPGEFYERLKGLPGFNPRELAWDFENEKQAIQLLSDEDRERWVRYHLPREKQWFMIAEYILQHEDPDLLAVMFDGVDKLQHQAWAFIDPDRVDGEADVYHRRMHGLCMDYFRQLDQFLEQLVTQAGPEVQVFLASDHGFTSTYEVVRINAYLHEKGYLHWKETERTEEAFRREQSMFANLDWSRTTAYCRTPSSNGIYIRVSDGEDGTGIRPEDYETFREQLIRDLEELRDPATDERILSGIYNREDVFAGAAMEDAPDLLLTLRDCGFVSIKNKKPFVEERPEIAGTHHPEGVFFAMGPGIVNGAGPQSMRIMDVASILLYSLGIAVPEDFEGEIPEGIFSPEHLAHNPVLIGGASLTEDNRAADGEEMSREEEDAIKAQLKLLGYLE